MKNRYIIIFTLFLVVASSTPSTSEDLSIVVFIYLKLSEKLRCLGTYTTPTKVVTTCMCVTNSMIYNFPPFRTDELLVSKPFAKEKYNPVNVIRQKRCRINYENNLIDNDVSAIILPDELTGTVWTIRKSDVDDDLVLNYTTMAVKMSFTQCQPVFERFLSGFGGKIPAGSLSIMPGTPLFANGVIYAIFMDSINNWRAIYGDDEIVQI